MRAATSNAMQATPTNRPNEDNASLAKLVLACAILLAVIGPASIAVAVGAEGAISWRVVAFAAAAGVICYMATASSLVAVFVGNQVGLPVQGMLLGMLFRMGLPLAALIAFGNQRTLGA